MDDDLNEEIVEFFRKLNLSNYEVNTLLTSSTRDFLSARELSKRSGVPSGRIYEILDLLNEKELIEIQETRPKKYRSIPLNQAFNKLIDAKTNEQQKEITFLFNQARDIESRLFDEKLSYDQETSKIFWRTAFGGRPIAAMYMKYINDSKEELLFSGFLNRNTLKVLPLNKRLYKSILLALNRGVKGKILWSFEQDVNTLTDEQKADDMIIYSKMLTIFKEKLNLIPIEGELEIKYVYKTLPTYYDLIDKKRIFLKLQNPLYPSLIFACVNIIEPKLAKVLRKNFLDIWTYHAEY